MVIISFFLCFFLHFQIAEDAAKNNSDKLSDGMAGSKNPLSVNYVSEERILESIAFLDNLEFILNNNNLLSNNSNNNDIKSKNNETYNTNNNNKYTNENQNQNQNYTVSLIPENLNIPLNVTYPAQGCIQVGKKNKIVDELILPYSERIELFNLSNKMDCVDKKKSQMKNKNLNENITGVQISQKKNENENAENTHTMSSLINLKNIDQLKTVKSPLQNKYDNKNDYNSNSNNNDNNKNKNKNNNNNNNYNNNNKTIILPTENNLKNEEINSKIEASATISLQVKKDNGVIYVEEIKKADPVPKIPVFLTEEDEMREKELLKNTADMNISQQAHQVS
jgi:hypothetical protein